MIQILKNGHIDGTPGISGNVGRMSFRPRPTCEVLRVPSRQGDLTGRRESFAPGFDFTKRDHSPHGLFSSGRCGGGVGLRVGRRGSSFSRNTIGWPSTVVLWRVGSTGGGTSAAHTFTSWAGGVRLGSIFLSSDSVQQSSLFWTPRASSFIHFRSFRMSQFKAMMARRRRSAAIVHQRFSFCIFPSEFGLRLLICLGNDRVGS